MGPDSELRAARAKVYHVGRAQLLYNVLQHRATSLDLGGLKVRDASFAGVLVERWLTSCWCQVLLDTLKDHELVKQVCQGGLSRAPKG